MSSSAGDMVLDALKKMGIQLLKLVALLFALVIEWSGKLLVWISSKVKQYAK